jgi:hypothetical protein
MARIQRSQYGRLWYSTFNCFVQATRPRFPRLHQLWLLCKLRENLSPFTKDFRAEELREYSTVFEPLLCKGDNRKQRWASSVLGWGGASSTSSRREPWNGTFMHGFVLPPNILTFLGRFKQRSGDVLVGYYPTYSGTPFSPSSSEERLRALNVFGLRLVLLIGRYKVAHESLRQNCVVSRQMGGILEI